MISKFSKFLPPESIKINEPMKYHTTFRIGGPADFMITPQTLKELQTTIQFCRTNEINYIVIGMGSNLLVSDAGYRGAIINVGRQMRHIEVSGDIIIAEAGIRLAELAKKAAAECLSGLEFAEGIPGSLGGGIFMNAGAYGSELKNVITEVKAINAADGSIRVFKPEELGFGYRRSIFQKNNYIIYSAQLNLKKGNSEEIHALMKKYSTSRREKQPLEFASAGSTFKRPPGYYVGPMIEELGLKGFSIGDAQVSEKHAGFVINRGNASAKDVTDLINYIQQKVYEKYQVSLEPEVRLIGDF